MNTTVSSDGFSGYFQIPIDPVINEKTTFTGPYGTFAYRRMPFGLMQLAPGVSTMYVRQIFLDMVEKDDESLLWTTSRVFGNSFKLLSVRPNASKV
ncbi:hypothetical protein Tco_0683434 [Tanacetum coccineum]|uniref:Uncharacterized protein n=1 Tax=Tanacetum coccineum TaxID=301880 RepID=A0ABQ4XTY7_9ASTR